MINHLQKNWWLLTFRGVLSILLGIIAAIYPELVLWVLLTFIGAIGLVSGVILLLEGMSFKNSLDRNVKIAEGLINIIFALIVMIHPVHSLEILIYILSIWVIIVGFSHIFWAFLFRKIIINEWIGIFNGILTLIFGFLLFFKLIGAAEVVVTAIGFFYIISGILMTLQSLRHKNLQPV